MTPRAGLVGRGSMSGNMARHLVVARTDAALAAFGFDVRTSDARTVPADASLFGNTFLGFRAAT